MATFTFEAMHKPTSGNPQRCFVFLRITESRKLKRIKSIEVTLKDGKTAAEVLNPKEKWANGHYLNKAAIREEREIKNLDSILYDDLQKAKATFKELQDKGIASAEKIKSELASVGNCGSFIEFVDAIIEELENAGKVSDSKKFNGFRNKLHGFMKKKKQSDVLFKELTSAFLNEFEAYLNTLNNSIQQEKKLHPNTIKENIVLLKRAINKAIERGAMEVNENPFATYKMPKDVKTNKEKLNEEEIGNLKSVEVVKSSVLEKAKDTFLFSFYCAGIRFEDVALMRCGNIIGDRLVYTMNKNGKKRDLKLIPEALEIVERYSQGRKPNEYLFRLLEDAAPYAKAITYDDINTMRMDIKKILYGRIGSQNALINKELKKLANKAGISKNVSFHIARHSFASRAKEKGINSMKIKGLLAHSKVETTERYMGEFDTEETDAALAEIFQEDSIKAKLIGIISRMDEAQAEALLEHIQKGNPL